jgi:carbamoyl-phosphate synthase large subunit
LNILITSASRKVSLVRAFQHALAEAGGGQVIAVDCAPLAPALFFSDQRYLVPRTDDPRFLEAIIDLCRTKHIQAIVPTRDEELPLFAEWKAKFLEIGTRVVTPDSDVVRICQDKREFIGFCAESGFLVPETYEASELERVPLPAFVKPRYGKGGQHTHRVSSHDELRWACERVPQPIIQRFVDAPEYTIDLFADFEGRVISVVPRRRVRVVAGESYISTTVREPALSDEAKRLAEALGLTGHCTIQCFFDGRVIFIEVNPRYGGAANLGFAAGAPSPQYLVRLLRGEAVEPHVGDYEAGLTMLRYTDDYFILEPDIEAW